MHSNTLFRHLLTLITLMAVSMPLAAQNPRNLVERVRYCRNSFVLCNGITPSEFSTWETNNVALEKQKRTYINRYNEPPKNNVRHLVFVSAGQQGGGGGGNSLTAQQAGYKDNFSRTDGSQPCDMRAFSLIERSITDTPRGWDDTFAASAWDARYNWDFTPENKAEIVNAYFQWLNTKFNASALQSVYLAGHSRGGMLAMALARRFKQQYPNLPVILHMVDAVPNTHDGEAGVFMTPVDSPVMNGHFAWQSDFRIQFPIRNNLRIFNMVGGEMFWIPECGNLAECMLVGGAGLAQMFSNTNVDDIRTFIHTEAANATNNPVEMTWYAQRWYPLDHDEMGDDWGVVDDAIDDLRFVAQPMIDAYVAGLPPTVHASVTPGFSQGDSVTLTFSVLEASSPGGAPVSIRWEFSDGVVTTGNSRTVTLNRPAHMQSVTLSGTVTVTDQNNQLTDTRTVAAILERRPGDGEMQ